MHILLKKISPRKVWGFTNVYVTELRYMTVFPNAQLKGRITPEVLTGDTTKILPYLELEWYENFWYLNTGSFPSDKRKLGR